MKNKDVLIIAQLRRNARLQLTDISSRTGIPISTVYDRIRGYAGRSVKKYAAILDFPELGFPITAHATFAVEKTQKAEFGGHLTRHPNVNSVYRINNGHDFMAEVIYPDISGLESFMDRLQERFKIRDKKVYYVVDELKKEEFLNDAKMLPEMPT